MQQVKDIYLSNSAEIIRTPWTKQTYERTIKFSTVELTIKCTCGVTDGCWKGQLSLNQGQNQYSNNIYCVQLRNTQNDISSFIKNGDTWTFIQDAKLGDKNYSDFVQQSCENINGCNYLTIYFWRKGDLTEEQKFLELTDGFIQADNTTYYVNVSMLAKSSQVIYNMIKDLQLSYDPQNRVDFSTLFEGFSNIHIQMYLCFSYNNDFMFQLLSDILGVLQIAVKLDNQVLIERVMNFEDLGRIVKKQLQTDVQKSCCSPCHILNVLEFAMKYKMHNLILFCELTHLSHSDKNPTATMKRLFQHFY